MGASAADAAASAEREVELLLRWPEPAPRSAVLDVAPGAGLAGQSARGAAQRRADRLLALAEGRGRYRLELPEAAQRPRANSLGLGFARADERGVAALLYGVVIGPARDERLGELAAPGAPPPLTVSGAGEAAEIVQVAPSTLRFAFLAPPDGELRFRPELRENRADVPVGVQRAARGSGRTGARALAAHARACAARRPGSSACRSASPPARRCGSRCGSRPNAAPGAAGVRLA